MKQGRIAKILRVFSVLSGISGGIFFFWFMPMCINEVVKIEESLTFLKWPGTIMMWVIAGVCYYALYNFFKVCDHIEQGNSFCEDNVLNMKNIGNAATIVTIIILLGDICLLIAGWLHPFMIVVSLISIFIASSFTVISYALSYLIDNAVKIKEENDLTI